LNSSNQADINIMATEPIKIMTKTHQVHHISLEYSDINMFPLAFSGTSKFLLWWL